MLSDKFPLISLKHILFDLSIGFIYINIEKKSTNRFSFKLWCYLGYFEKNSQKSIAVWKIL